MVKNARKYLLRILSVNTKFPLFMGFVEWNKNYPLKYAILG